MDIDTFFARSETGTSTNSYYGVHPHEPYRWQTQGSLTRPEPKGAKKTLKKPDKLMKARTVGRGKGPDPWVHMKVRQVKKGKGARLAGEGRNCQTGEGVRLAGEGVRLAGAGHCVPRKKGRGKQRPLVLTGGGPKCAGCRVALVLFALLKRVNSRLSRILYASRETIEQNEARPRATAIASTRPTLTRKLEQRFSA